MNSLRQLKGGYTIVEVMIVLAISGALFLTAITGLSQQNNRTQFTQAVHEIETKTQDILNDVATGYYPNNGNFTCTRTASGPVIDKLTPEEQGKNVDCIFIGKAITFDNIDGFENLKAYSIVGLRNQRNDLTNTKRSTNLDDAAPRTITGVSGAVDSSSLHGSIEIVKILEGDGSTNVQVFGFGIITGFGKESGGSGATNNQSKIAAIPTTNFTSGVIPTLKDSDLGKLVTICAQEAGGGRHAMITIGNGSRSNIQTFIDVDDAKWKPGCGA